MKEKMSFRKKTAFQDGPAFLKSLLDGEKKKRGGQETEGGLGGKGKGCYRLNAPLEVARGRGGLS